MFRMRDNGEEAKSASIPSLLLLSIRFVVCFILVVSTREGEMNCESAEKKTRLLWFDMFRKRRGIVRMRVVNNRRQKRRTTTKPSVWLVVIRGFAVDVLWQK